MNLTFTSNSKFNLNQLPLKSISFRNNNNLSAVSLNPDQMATRLLGSVKSDNWTVEKLIEFSPEKKKTLLNKIFGNSSKNNSAVQSPEFIASLKLPENNDINVRIKMVMLIDYGCCCNAEVTVINNKTHECRKADICDANSPLFQIGVEVGDKMGCNWIKEFAPKARRIYQGF